MNENLFPIDKRISTEYQSLNRRSVSEWKRCLREIKNDGLKFKVAAIVWWDWFLPNRKHSKTIEKMVRSLQEEHYYLNMEKDIFEALIQLGYSSFLAKKRSRIPTSKVESAQSSTRKDPAYDQNDNRTFI